MSDIPESNDSDAFRVQLPLFCGPLDLLLYLVRKNELELAEIPIAKITEQFLEYLNVLQLLDIDAVGDFIAMAATLMEMKSQELLPTCEESTEEAEVEDPRDNLVQRLLEYREYREAAAQLEQRSRLWQRQYPRFVDDFADTKRDIGDEPIAELELWDLVSALARVLRTHEKLDEPKIRYDDTPIHVHIERILRRLQELADADANGVATLAFTTLFSSDMTRSRVVGIFLAILELARHHHVKLTQETPYGEILLTWRAALSNEQAEESTVS